MKYITKKNLKRYLVCILIITYVCMLIPFMDVYATPVNETTVSSDDGSTLPFVITNNSDDVFMFKTDSTTPWYIVSLSPFSYPYCGDSDYGSASKTWIYDESGNRTNYFMYSKSYGNFGHIGTKWYENFDGPYYYISSSDSHEYERIIYNFLTTGSSDGIDTSHAQIEGCIDNPIYDDDIGTLIISKSKMYEESNGENVNDLYNLFSWKMKTSTCFSLSDNKYARTFIQVRVESKCVVYDDLRHTKIYKQFDNYGEKAMLINSHSADSQPLKISYLTDIPNVLPKTHSETHNPLYVGYNYTLYFRVVCTNDLAVIPSDTSEWHCGGWRALDCNADMLVGQTDTSENGSFDESDNWVAGADDGNNSIESGSDTVHDSDDAQDNFNSSSSNNFNEIDGGTISSLIKQVGAFPSIISKVFSFLPDWCLQFLALGFACFITLLLIKVVRG